MAISGDTALEISRRFCSIILVLQRDHGGCDVESRVFNREGNFMSMRIPLFQAILAGLLFMGTSAARAAPAGELSEGEFQSLLDTYNQRVKGIHIRFHLKVGKEPSADIDLWWDRRADRVNSSLAQAWKGHSPVMQVWVLNAKSETIATQAHEKNAPFPWIGRVYAPGKGSVAREIQDSMYGLKYVGEMSSAFVPPLKKYAQKLARAHLKVQMTVARRDAQGKPDLIRYSLMTAGGRETGRCEYHLDLSDGLRILCVVQSHLGSDERWVESERWDYGNFKKSGKELWFPFTYRHRLWDEKGKVIMDSEVSAKSVEVNPDFTSAAFVYDPPAGTLIQNHLTGKDYLAGEEPPATAPTNQADDGRH